MSARKRLVAAGLAMTVALISGCSNQQVYSAIQANRANDCARTAAASNLEECLEPTRLGYQAYRVRATRP